MCKGLCCRNVAGTAIKSTFSRTHPWTRVLQERDCRAAYSNIFQDRWHIHAWIRGMEARFSEVVLCDRVRDGWMILFQRIQDTFQLLHFPLLHKDHAATSIHGGKHMLHATTQQKAEHSSLAKIDAETLGFLPAISSLFYSAPSRRPSSSQHENIVTSCRAWNACPLKGANPRLTVCIGCAHACTRAWHTHLWAILCLLLRHPRPRSHDALRAELKLETDQPKLT